MSKRTWGIMTVALIILLDFLIVPTIIHVPFLIVEYNAMWLPELINNFHLIEAIVRLKDENYLYPFLILQPVVLMLCVSVFWTNKLKRKRNKITDSVGGPEAAGNGQFGTSRWQTEEETTKSSFLWRMGEDLKEGGIVIGQNADSKSAWLVQEDLHTLIIGATRSGKSRRWVMPTIWALAHAGESMVLTDPKGELYDRNKSYLIKKGYKVKVLDFRNPGRGNRWNPLHTVTGSLDVNDVPKAVQQAWSIAHMFVHQKPQNPNGESIWRDGAESVIAALNLVVAMESKKTDEKHMTSVYKTLAELGEIQKVQIGNQMMDYVPLSEYMKSLPMNHPARDAYATARLSPERTRGSFFANVSSLLRLFSDPAMAYLTGVQDHNLADVGKEKTAVFLIIPDEDKTRHPLAALYVNQTYQALVDLANQNLHPTRRGRVPVRVNFLLDEWGNMPPFKDFDTALTVSGGRGIRWHLIVQGFNQIDAAYGNNIAETIRGNCHIWMYLLTMNSKTAKEISEKCGTYTIYTESDGYSVAAGKNSGSSNLSNSLTKRNLLTQDEVERWPRELALVLRAGQLPAKLSLPDLSEWPADRDLVFHDDEEQGAISMVPIFIPELGITPNEEDKEQDSREEDVNSSETAFSNID